MRSTVLTVEVWFHDERYFFTIPENSGFCGRAILSGSESESRLIHATAVDQFVYWHRCAGFIGEITPFEDGLEFIDDLEDEDE